jgi:hypothetical protein
VTEFEGPIDPDDENQDDDERDDQEDGMQATLGPRIPEGAFVSAQISVVQWIDHDDGSLKFSLRYNGDVPLTQFLGLLRVAEYEMIRESKGW